MVKDHFRAHGRRAIDLPATIRAVAASSHTPARVVDLSLGGACLEVPEGIAPGAAIVVQILVPTLWDPLVLEGRVAWANRSADKAKLGVVFQHREGAPLVALVELLAAHSY